MPTCQNCKNNFVITEEDRAFYTKIQVPEPTWCSRCRMIRRFAFRRTRALYKRKVIGSEKEVLTPFAPDSKAKVILESEWNSDKWDGMDFGRDYDFSRPFFEQLKELAHEVPWPHTYNVRSENSDYCSDVEGLKNCYLLTNSGWSQDSYYGSEVLKSSNCVDNLNVLECDLCYGCVDCQRCHGCVGSQDCVGCTNVLYSYNLADCQNCVGCVNLKHKSYCIFNKQYTKQEFELEIKKLRLNTVDGILRVKKEFALLKLSQPHRFMNGTGNENVSGDYLGHCKNTHESFVCTDLEDCKFNQYILFVQSKDCYDITVSGGELCCELEEAGGYNMKFCYIAAPTDLSNGILGTSDMEYCVYCLGGSNLFACAALKKKEYCIFNKQYSKEAFFSLRKKIIKHMNDMPYIDPEGRVYKYGEFLPYSLSPFAYNETLAQEYFPLSKEEALKQGFEWRDLAKQEREATVQIKDIPKNIEEVGEGIVQEMFQCEHDGTCLDVCSKVFRVIPQELQFYKNQKLPLPRMCYNCRHAERLKRRNPLELYGRECMCVLDHKHSGAGRCSNKFQTTFAPTRPEKVYCEDCFRRATV